MTPTAYITILLTCIALLALGYLAVRHGWADKQDVVAGGIVVVALVALWEIVTGRRKDHRRTPSGKSDDATGLAPADDTPTTYHPPDKIDELLDQTIDEPANGDPDVSADDPADWRL